MHVPNKYFHNRLILFLLSTNVFLTILTCILILGRIDGGASTYTIQYRANQGLGGFEFGGSLTFFLFALFAVITLVVHTILSMRIFDESKDYAAAILGLGTLLVILTMIVGTSLPVVG